MSERERQAALRVDRDGAAAVDMSGKTSGAGVCDAKKPVTVEAVRRVATDLAASSAYLKTAQSIGQGTITQLLKA